MDHIDLLRAVMRKAKTMHPFHIDAMVILPDYLHALRTLPLGDGDHAARRKERGICDPRYWEHRIRDERAPAKHVDDVHCNPAKHGYVTRACE
ncbi:hypothetical protein [Thiocapsa sp.]|uniref:hypothetical protein n=1 Tax=Thiocapsa sp. TaxID=2024551 RepID=UPI003594027C